MPLVILTGASGAGKTTIAAAIEHRYARQFDIFYKDRIGVPPVQEMIDRFGSVEGWQRAATCEWMARLAPLLAQGRSVLFEGQSRFSFLAEAADQAGIAAYTAILVDCDDDTRTRRLSVDRGQAELANAEMMNWAGFLRNEASVCGCEILDTAQLTLDQAIARVVCRLRPPLFDLETCAESAQAGRLQNWVLDYLAAGHSANPGLRAGLLLQKRYWLGPLSLALSRLERCCGPEAGMAYRVPAGIWAERIESMASGLVDVESLPPLIVEWRARHLLIRDGNHRHAAMTLKGWSCCFVVIWCNSEDDFGAALRLTA